jgi:hypothetical protein
VALPPPGTATAATPGANAGSGGSADITGSGENGFGPEHRMIDTLGDDSIRFVNASQTLVPVSSFAWSPTSSVPSAMNPCLPSWTRAPGSFAPTFPEFTNESLPSRAP